MAKIKKTRRPSTGECASCGGPIALVECFHVTDWKGRNVHKWEYMKMTPYQRKTACNGRVYIHLGNENSNGSEDCDSGGTASYIDKHGYYWR